MQGAAERAPEPQPQERVEPAKEGSAEKEAPERSERQKTWREEIDRQRDQGRDGSDRERE
jgi:hypothetical protein